MGKQPRVDAGDMEPVAARRQHADLVPVGEVGEADGAAWRRRSGGRRRRGRPSAGSVGGDGQRDDVLALEAGVVAALGDPGGRVGDGAAGAAHHALQHGIEAQGADQRADHRRQYDHHIVVQRRLTSAAAGLCRNRRRGAAGGGERELMVVRLLGHNQLYSKKLIVKKKGRPGMHVYLSPLEMKMKMEAQNSTKE